MFVRSALIEKLKFSIEFEYEKKVWVKSDCVIQQNLKHKEKYLKQDESDFEKSLSSESDEASYRASIREEIGHAMQIREIGSIGKPKR